MSSHQASRPNQMLTIARALDAIDKEAQCSGALLVEPSELYRMLAAVYAAAFGGNLDIAILHDEMGYLRCIGE